MPFKKKNEWVADSFYATCNGLMLRAWKLHLRKPVPEREWMWALTIEGVYLIESGHTPSLEEAQKVLIKLAKGKHKNARKLHDKALQDGLTVVIAEQETA